MSATDLPKQDEVFTPEQAAEKLTVSRDWLMKAVRDGKVPCIKYGKRTRFTAEDIAQIMALHRVAPKPATPDDTWGRVTKSRKTS